MFLVIEENPNCEASERVFSESGPHKKVSQLNLEHPNGTHGWCDVIAVEEQGGFSSAQAVQVEDSGAGNAWLIFGGMWGLRFRSANSKDEWSLQNSSQWGVPFKVLDISGEDIRFT